jgi:hypothetical protein
MTDFAGLPTLLQTHCPHPAFIQEVFPHPSLLSMAAATGYSTFLSTSTSPPKQKNTVLAHVPVQVSALTPGYTQLVLLGDLSFIHLHLPFSGWVAGAAMLHGLQHSLQWPVLPILVDDFHCVIHQMDTEDLSCVVNQKFSQALFDNV